jgi:hypothetical protein
MDGGCFSLEDPWPGSDSRQIDGDEMWGEDELELEEEHEGGGYLSEGWDTDDYDPSTIGKSVHIPGGAPTFIFPSDSSTSPGENRTGVLRVLLSDVSGARKIHRLYIKGLVLGRIADVHCPVTAGQTHHICLKPAPLSSP